MGAFLGKRSPVDVGSDLGVSMLVLQWFKIYLIVSVGSVMLSTHRVLESEQGPSLFLTVSAYGLVVSGLDN